MLCKICGGSNFRFDGVQHQAMCDKQRLVCRQCGTIHLGPPMPKGTLGDKRLSTVRAVWPPIASVISRGKVEAVGAASIKRGLVQTIKVAVQRVISIAKPIHGVRPKLSGSHYPLPVDVVPQKTLVTEVRSKGEVEEVYKTVMVPRVYDDFAKKMGFYRPRDDVRVDLGTGKQLPVKKLLLASELYLEYGEDGMPTYTITKDFNSGRISHIGIKGRGKYSQFHDGTDYDSRWHQTPVAYDITLVG